MRRSSSAPAQPRVLLGARDAAFAGEAARQLREAGCAVQAGRDPASLAAACAAERPDLVLLAFDAMQADGFALCRALVAAHAAPPLPVVVLCPEPAAAAALAAGAAEVAAAPPAWPLLLHRIARLLAGARARAQLARAQAALDRIQRIGRLGSWTLELASGQMEWSEHIHEILGLEPGGPSDFEGFAMCLHPEDREAAVSAMRAAEPGQIFSAVARVVVPSGGVRHVELRGERAGEGWLQGSLQDVTEQRRAQEKIRLLAHFDSLTGLANRRRFMEQIERARARCEGERKKMALLYLDLDHFKRINDTLGHSAGDALLRAVSDLLFDKVRSTDVVGRPAATEDSEISRLGGDEFAVLLTRIGTREDARQVAGRILVALPTPINVDGHEITTTGSIGIAVYPDDGEDVETLVKHADRALYHAKERGRNGFQFFSEALNAGAARRLSMESRLRAAVEGDLMRLAYQPRLDLVSGRVEAVEALLRWTDPELGRVSPKEFIPLAEETGLIVGLGAWVLRAACAQGAAWVRAGLDPLRVSVNVSTTQFRRDDLIATVARALEETGFDPRRLELEITESLMLQDDEATATALRELRAMGLRIALDDFGTGYSSLSYLARYPLDFLKLDRSLVRDLTEDPHARGIATAVISMAHVLGLRVVAEGVDQQEQLAELRRQGCDEIQGFLIAGALPPEEVVAHLASDLPAPSSLSASGRRAGLRVRATPRG
jgi:diguanylate cyclase (GGDEF)-like protein